MPTNDLSVQCTRSGPAGRELHFAAERATPSQGHWILCVESDRRAVHVTAVLPAPVGWSIDRDGVLGLIFPATTSSAVVCVEGDGRAASDWSFWVDDGADVSAKGPGDGPGPAARC